jgi:uncharacterized protein YgbK (DUF1537 family)
MKGYTLLYRTAASVVTANAGLESRPLLTLHSFDHCSDRGALIVVGSYVPRSSRQLEILLKSENIKGWEIPVHSVLNPKQRKFVLEQIKSDLDRRVRKGQDTVLYTSRTLVKGSNRRESLAISRQVSDAVVSIVGSLQEQPRYILAKGGITSSDLATRALGVKKALVQGQILPGVPVWKLGSESRHPALNLIVFPGNVGEETSLLEVVSMLRPVSQSLKSERT